MQGQQRQLNYNDPLMHNLMITTPSNEACIPVLLHVRYLLREQTIVRGHIVIVMANLQKITILLLIALTFTTQVLIYLA